MSDPLPEKEALGGPVAKSDDLAKLVALRERIHHRQELARWIGGALGISIVVAATMCGPAPRSRHAGHGHVGATHRPQSTPVPFDPAASSAPANPALVY